MSGDNIFDLVKADSDWKHNDYTSIPERGIDDFFRDISFSRVLSKEELDKVKKTLAAEEKCPGWTGVNGWLSSEKDITYRFTTTWDSSG